MKIFNSKKMIVPAVLAVLVLYAVPSFALSDGSFYLNEGFDGTLTDVLAGGWADQSTTGEIDAADSVLSFEANGAADAQTFRKQSTGLPASYSMETRLRLRAAGDNQRLAIIIYDANGTRLFVQFYAGKLNFRNAQNAWVGVNKPHELGTWYTYNITVKNGYATIYRRAEGASEYELMIDNQPMHAMSGDRVDLISEGAAVSADVDYVKIWGGAAAVDQKFLYGGETAESLIGGETLTAQTTIYYDDADGDGNIKPLLLLALYNSGGKMIDYTFENGDLLPGTSRTVAASLELPDEDLSGMTAEMYLWDSIGGIQPIGSLAVLP